MKNGFLLVLIFFLYESNLCANVIKAEDNQLRLNLTATQSLINDWQQGNVKTLECLLGIDYRSVLRIDTFRLRSRLNISYGAVYKKDEKLIKESFIPTENKFSGEAILSYPIGWKVDPFISGSFQTQISESFILNNDNKLRTAKLWGPVIAQQCFGFDYFYTKNKNNFSSNLGISIKQIRAFYHTNQTDNPKTLDIKEKYFTDAGIRWKTDVLWQFNDNVNLRSTIDLFSSYADFSKWSVKLNNDIKLVLYKDFAVLVTLNCYYDEKQALYLQYKQMFSIGIVADF